MPTRILIAYSSAGGGHRSVSVALAEALEDRHGAGVHVDLVDALAKHTPFPFNRLAAWYPSMVRSPSVWALLYRSTDSLVAVRLINRLAWPFVRRQISGFLADHPADAVVVTNSLLVSAIVHAPALPGVPRVVMVTDLGTIHASWFEPRADLCLVPTEAAAECALAHGTPRERIRVTGLPVAKAATEAAEDRDALRRRFGWTSGRPVVLLVGGGEGMGPVARVARAIGAAGLDCELVVVAGKNRALEERLAAEAWHVPAHVYGFVREMPWFMHAADILVTKAGAATICEALAAGLPIVIYGRLPGQEDGNVAYVTASGAGVWAPTPSEVVARLARWLEHGTGPVLLCEARRAARLAARSSAARDAADLIWEIAHGRAEG